MNGSEQTHSISMSMEVDDKSRNKFFDAASFEEEKEREELLTEDEMF
jgi:hypothetical protein